MIELPSRIALCGVSRSGKSTLGNAFGLRFGYSVTAFADPLKRAAREVFGFDMEHLYGPSEAREVPYTNFTFSGHCFQCNRQCDNLGSTGWYCPKCCASYPRHVTPRLALQTLGTEWGRKLCPEIWTEACFASMREDRSYVITDCRFDNEREAARAHQSCVVLLLRGLAQSTSPHPSESGIREAAKRPELFDIVLDNREGGPRENFDSLVSKMKKLGAPRRAGITWRKYKDKEETR